MSVPAGHRSPAAGDAGDGPRDALLTVDGLDVVYRDRRGGLPAVRDVSFTLARGEVFGLVGESGSGKSTVLSALTRLLPHSATVSARRLHLDGLDLSRAGEAQLRKLRGDRIGLVPQRPLTSLSPVTPVRTQLRRLAGPTVDDARLDVLMRSVGLAGLTPRLSDYPYRFSGGQLQRMLIAVAVLAREPQLVLADEPTTTLDVTVQAQILRLLLDLRDRLGNSIIFVSHDLAVISQICDRVGVMYGGRLVEVAATEDLFAAPRHPYTRALMNAMPARHERGERLRSIEGTVSGSHRLPGCPFAPRCPRVDEQCGDVDPEPRPFDRATIRCHHPEEAA